MVGSGSLGGLKGGPARALALSPARRSEIARDAATVRWERRLDERRMAVLVAIAVSWDVRGKGPQQAELPTVTELTLDVVRGTVARLVGWRLVQIDPETRRLDLTQLGWRRVRELGYPSS